MHKRQWNLDLSDQVIIDLLVTTTFNVLGLMYIVLEGMFPNKSKSNNYGSE